MGSLRENRTMAYLGVVTRNKNCEIISTKLDMFIGMQMKFAERVKRFS